MASEAGRESDPPAYREATLGGLHGYPDFFRFPCCGVTVESVVQQPPSQFRSDGCKAMPERQLGRGHARYGAEALDLLRQLLRNEDLVGAARRIWGTSN